jgi:3-methyladenine DNA glycosylase Tag
MKKFATFYKRAEKRTGGKAQIEKLLPKAKSSRGLRAVTDDRYFSEMSRRIFQAGLKHSMVDAKWPAFEEAFEGFVPNIVASFPDERIEVFMGDKRLIRHLGKLRATHANAAAMVAVAAEFGSFGAYLAGWPDDDTVGLWRDLAKRFKQLGGNSGPYFLRRMGKDSFVLTQDVLAALTEAKVIDGKATSQSALRNVQSAFNSWAAESGRPKCQISRILALSIG